MRLKCAEPAGRLRMAAGDVLPAFDYRVIEAAVA
jgi:hypothetical protein